MFRRKRVLIVFVVSVFCILNVMALSGDLNPAGPPTAGTTNTLDEINSKIDFLITKCDKVNIPRTGQTTSYATGDDGDLQKGVTWPNPRFTNNNDGTVTDNLTGLIWLKDASCFGVKTWTEALTECNNLASGSCGLSDNSTAGEWRLPNRTELESLLNYAYYDPMLSNTSGTAQWTEGNPFTGVQSNYYWSSTTIPVLSENTCIIDMIYGLVIYAVKTAGTHMWPVRDDN